MAGLAIICLSFLKLTLEDFSRQPAGPQTLRRHAYATLDVNLYMHTELILVIQVWSWNLEAFVH